MSRASIARAVAATSHPRDTLAVRAAVRRFDPRVRLRVEAMACAHAYFAEYITVFPAVLHALALAPAENAKAAEAEAQIRAGAPMRRVAETLGLPVWLRALPPEAFTGEIPVLPSSPDFTLRIANALPEKTKDARRWLAYVALAHRAAHEDFALWTAANFSSFGPRVDAADLTGLAVFAWFSRERSTEAAWYIADPWHRDIEAGEAINRASQWLDRLDFAMLGAPNVIRMTPTTNVDGYEFFPLATANDVFEAAETLRNCLATYAQTLACGSNQVWKISKDGSVVAAVQIRFEDETKGVPLLLQARGRYNTAPASEELRAIYRWLLAWPERGPVVPHDQCCKYGDPTNYRRLMKPYWRAKGLVPWLPYNDDGDRPSEVRASIGRIASRRFERLLRRN